MADLGFIAQMLALATAVYAAAAAFLGAQRRYPELVASAENAVLAVGGLVSLATGALLYAFLSHDFQVRYVAENSSRTQPFFYTLTALWGGQSGSLLFWAWLLALFAVVVVLQNRNKHRQLMPYVSMGLMITEAFFLILVIFVSNPFERLPFVPSDGMGLNPLLQNPGMVFHPPTLYLGYVGFVVPFAFAMAALITRRVTSEWIQITRRWTLVTWLFLSVGILLGAQWAYVELGWGGYWAWDPVENASLLPWLAGTAFLHSVMIQERRGMLKVWNMVLVMLTFILSIFGTFITRSGIISSVHSFTQSSLGPFFLAFMGATVLIFLYLLFERLDDLRSKNELDSLVSRESSFLANNLLLLGITFAVFWGTIFPMVSEAVTGNKITVGPPFFNQVNGPIFAGLIVLMGICPLIGWRRASPERLLRNLMRPFVAMAIFAVGLFLLGVRQPYALVGFTICAFVATSTLLEFYRGAVVRHRSTGENYLRALVTLVSRSRRRHGGYMVHLAVILMAVGIVGSNVYQVERQATLTRGESMTIGDYTLTYEGLSQYPTQDKRVVAATLTVYQGGRQIGRLVPRKDYHRNADQPMTETAIRTTLKEDLYVILGGWEGNGDTATFKAYVNPMVVWIWIGGVLLVAGTLIAAWPEPQRVPMPVRRYVREPGARPSEVRSSGS